MIKTHPKAPHLTAHEAKARFDFIDRVIEQYTGPIDQLEAALGMYFVGLRLGWKPLALAHSKRTVRTYEAILGLKINEEFEPEGPDAARSAGLRAASGRPNFWRVVSGDDALDRETRKRID